MIQRQDIISTRGDNGRNVLLDDVGVIARSLMVSHHEGANLREPLTGGHVTSCDVT